jgi:hypothetical protein
MNNNLEDFMQHNKDEFDDYEPSEAMWQRIEDRITEPEKKGVIVTIQNALGFGPKTNASQKKGLVISMGARKMMSAAAAVIVIASATFLFLKNGAKPTTTDPVEVAVVTPTKPTDTNIIRQDPTLAPDTLDKRKNDGILKNITLDNGSMSDNSANAMANIGREEMAHYTRLVELKQQQISILKKDEPLLYEQFSEDFSKIDGEFNKLKKQQLQHPNSEQLLEAMIENLKVQSALLNRQLEIVKYINDKKKKRYEKTYYQNL